MNITVNLSGVILALLALAVVSNVVLCLWIVQIARTARDGARAALINVQLQLSFIAGRIGVKNKDLQASTIESIKEEPSPDPEIVKGTGMAGDWDDAEELLQRIESGEVSFPGGIDGAVNPGR
jgi:hypothetical protein